MIVWVGVLLAGGAGAVLRFLVDGAVARRAARSFPFGTLTVNISGATLLGLLGGLALSRLRRFLHHVLHLDVGDPAAR
jgi:fluoride exporter